MSVSAGDATQVASIVADGATAVISGKCRDRCLEQVLRDPIELCVPCLSAAHHDNETSNSGCGSAVCIRLEEVRFRRLRNLGNPRKLN